MRCRSASTHTRGCADTPSTVEYSFGTIKAWMGATNFLTKTIPRVSTEISLHILAYNLKRAMQVVEIAPHESNEGLNSLLGYM